MEILFASCPPQAGEIEAQMIAYGIALEGHDPRDIEAAIRCFIRGEVNGHNPSFAPAASRLGAQVRKCMNDRLDSEARAKPLALPEPEVVVDPEARRRIAALAEQTANVLRGRGTRGFNAEDGA